jgi:hypothetical protein
VSQPRRLFGEGIAIVLSILLAFSIDAWWDVRRDRAEEQDVLGALQQEFLANRAEAAGVIRVHERGGARIAAAHRLSAAETAALPPDSVSATLLSLATPRTFDAVRGTLDALIGSGQMDLIRDAELRRALSVFLNLVGDSQEDAAYMAEGSRRVWDRQILHGGPWRRTASELESEGCDAPVPPSSCYIVDSDYSYFPAPTNEALAAVLADRQLMGQVRQLRSNVIRYVAEIRRIADQVDLVLALVNRNLQ